MLREYSKYNLPIRLFTERPCFRKMHKIILNFTHILKHGTSLDHKYLRT